MYEISFSKIKTQTLSLHLQIFVCVSSVSAYSDINTENGISEVTLAVYVCTQGQHA